MNLQVLAVGFLAFIGVRGVAYVLLFPTLSGEAKAEKRKRAIEGTPERGKRASRAAEVSKRDQVAQSLKDLEAKQKKAKIAAARRADRAGRPDLDRSRLLRLLASFWRRRWPSCVFLMSKSLIAAPVGPLRRRPRPAALVSQAPQAKRAREAFAEEFANALDVIVRGVKAGPAARRLPAHHRQRGAGAGQARVPHRRRDAGARRSDGRRRAAHLRAHAAARKRTSSPSSSPSRQKAGGNLSEALGNLSKVLRERKKMRAKIKAVSHGGQGIGRHHRRPADRRR